MPTSSPSTSSSSRRMQPSWPIAAFRSSTAPTDVILMMLKYLGKDGDTTNVADYQAVVEAFKPVREHIRTFDNTNYLNAIPNKELCVINNWSGDYSTAKARAEEAGVEINLAYFVPKTGAPAWVDCLCIPTDAPNVENAYKFLEYMLQPEVIAKCTNFTNYANGNIASKPFIDPAVLANPAVYPDEATLKRLWAPAASGRRPECRNDPRLERHQERLKTKARPSEAGLPTLGGAWPQQIPV